MSFVYGQSIIKTQGSEMSNRQIIKKSKRLGQGMKGMSRSAKNIREALIEHDILDEKDKALLDVIDSAFKGLLITTTGAYSNMKGVDDSTRETLVTDMQAIYETV